MRSIKSLLTKPEPPAPSGRDYPLTFLGCGSAFNTVLGNNSAYLKLGEDLLLIDCGGDVLPKLVKLHVFDGVRKVHIFITHLHSDHAGGLGNTILYLSSKVLRHEPRKICLYHPDRQIVDFLRMQGVVEDQHYTMYVNLWDELFLDDEYAWHPEYYFRPTKHVPTLEGHVWGLDLKMGREFHFFFSGDTCEWNPDCNDFTEYTAIYQEITEKDNPVHFTYEKLLAVTKNFTPEQKKRITLMHFDDDFNFARAEADGFSLAQPALKLSDLYPEEEKS